MITNIELDESQVSIYPTSPIDLRSFARSLENNVTEQFGNGAVVSSVHKSSIDIDKQVIYYFAVRLVEDTIICKKTLDFLYSMTVTTEDGNSIYPIRRIDISGPQQLRVFSELIDTSYEDSKCCILSFEIHLRDCFNKTHQLFMQKLLKHDESPLQLYNFHHRINVLSKGNPNSDEINAVNRIIASACFLSEKYNIMQISHHFANTMFSFTFENIKDIIGYEDLELFRISCRVKFGYPRNGNKIYDCCMSECLNIKIAEGKLVINLSMPPTDSITTVQNVKISSTNGVNNYKNTHELVGKSISVGSPMRRSGVLKAVQKTQKLTNHQNDDRLRKYAVSMFSSNNNVKVFP